ncbi:uncharacterized protein (TIGR00266 family) [Prosthecobacter fusiformis]|uniref:Uncharacterized protein (TIGR00266 family) n=1 Tax=Prosthecobacter fusiformis TaxID=48464 RepID=A0A4R7RNK3_9BACT|nr:uncharacterized protein (TIGR00266 family) [Prosthecobacter fusiformis]
MNPWFYVDSEGQRHQVSEEQLQSLASAGALRPESLVWTDGQAQWSRADQVLPALFNGAGRMPPPLAGPPPLPGGRGMRAHDVDYEIHGNEMQIVEVELDPGETVIAEAGGMNYMDDGIVFETKMGDGSSPSSGGLMGILKTVGKRVLTGESIFMTHFTNRASAGKKRVAFAAPYPGKIIPLKLTDYGGEILCEKDAFLCAAYGTSVGIAFQKRFGAGLFGGEGFILQRLQGDGMAFIHAGGTIIKKEMKGETLRVDTGCLVAFTQGISYDIERAGNLKSMFFGGEGLFLTTLTGHGTVWLQSLPFSRLADRILANAPSAGGKATGEGSVLGGIGRMFDGE